MWEKQIEAGRKRKVVLKLVDVDGHHVAFLGWEVCSGKSKRPRQADDQATEKSCRLRSDKSFVEWNEYDLSLIEKIS